MTENEQRPKRFLVTGATGFQGGAIARLLAQRGEDVTGLARNPPGPAPDRPGPAVPTVRGDLGSAEDMRRAFEGVTHAAVTLPLVYDKATVLRYARNLARAAHEAGVQRLVCNTNTPLPEVATRRPGFETRRAAEEVLRGSGVPTVVVRPPVYLDNLFSPWNGPALVDDGVLAYPLPAGERVAWMPHTDLAAVVAAALEAEDAVGRVLHVGGAEVLTGPQLAEAFARVWGREVVYQPLSVPQFEEGLSHVLGAEAAAGVAGIYHHVSTGEDPGLLAPDPGRTARRLGVRLTPVAEWIAAQPWDHWRRTTTDQGAVRLT
ncbi:NmrA family NAD(P)-binding protein [Streptomyces sp. N2-109]|uniref:NmrA family NAD(P)-binding protein n=1 Tax=Streptomyces gossypii TaxID=2883101 RepID=A0ABT2JWR5_9ACTN|nr:NmrA family NAD(P)-binding protein [Streptomyces gossypii]MCT2591760.1 NmrA family NAD(P)-binding protein [Streptomyces gossypii]